MREHDVAHGPAGVSGVSTCPGVDICQVRRCGVDISSEAAVLCRIETLIRSTNTTNIKIIKIITFIISIVSIAINTSSTNISIPTTINYSITTTINYSITTTTLFHIKWPTKGRTRFRISILHHVQRNHQAEATTVRDQVPHERARGRTHLTEDQKVSSQQKEKTEALPHLYVYSGGMQG